MKIENKYKIELAASDNPHRLPIQAIKLENQRAIATDGRILAIVPVEHEALEEGKQVRADDLEVIRKAQKSLSKSVGIVTADLTNGSVKSQGDAGQVFNFQYPETQFPNYKQVLPDADAEPVFSIGLDVHLLLRLARALGVEEKGTANVKLEFYDSEKAFRVVNPKEEKAWGVQMPVRIEQRNVVSKGGI